MLAALPTSTIVPTPPYLEPEGCQAEGTFPCDGIRMQHVFLDRCLPVARKQVPLKLIRALLLRSGIEQNPGPRYPCIFCDQNCNHGSLQCSGCKLWAHLRCAEITHREATRIWWKCFSCVSRGPEIPPNRYRGSRGLRVLQLNINGLRNKTSELSCILAEYQIDVAMIQETKLDQSTELHLFLDTAWFGKTGTVMEEA